MVPIPSFEKLVFRRSPERFRSFHRKKASPLQKMSFFKFVFATRGVSWKSKKKILKKRENFWYKSLIYQIRGAENDGNGFGTIFSMISKKKFFGYFTVGNPVVAKNWSGDAFFRWNDLNLSGAFLKTIFSKDKIRTNVIMGYFQKFQPP